MATYLYIKQHAVTNKLYFGKTNRNPEKYLGSGLHWMRHLEKHGKENVVTLWYHLFEDQNECTEFALSFSKQMGIVESNQWLNMKPENGLDGGSVKGIRQSKETITKKTGDNHPLFGKRGAETPRFGMKNTPESIAKMSAAQKGLVTVFDLIEQKVVKIPKIEFESNKGSKYVGVASKLAKNYLRQQ